MKKTKQILFTRGKFSFLCEDIWFDVTKCKFILSSNNLNCWLCFRLFCGGQKIIYGFNIGLRFYFIQIFTEIAEKRHQNSLVFFSNFHYLHSNILNTSKLNPILCTHTPL